MNPRKAFIIAYFYFSSSLNVQNRLETCRLQILFRIYFLRNLLNSSNTNQKLLKIWKLYEIWRNTIFDFFFHCLANMISCAPVRYTFTFKMFISRINVFFSILEVAKDVSLIRCLFIFCFPFYLIIIIIKICFLCTFSSLKFFIA